MQKRRCPAWRSVWPFVPDLEVPMRTPPSAKRQCRGGRQDFGAPPVATEVVNQNTYVSYFPGGPRHVSADATASWENGQSVTRRVV